MQNPIKNTRNEKLVSKFGSFVKLTGLAAAIAFSASACVSTDDDADVPIAGSVVPEADEHYPAPGKVDRVVPEDGVSSYKIYTDNKIQLRVEFFGADCFRIQAAKDGEFDDPRNDPEKAQILLDPLPTNRSLVSVVQLPEKIVFKTDELTLTLDRETCMFTLAKSDGTPVWKESRPLAFEGDKTVQLLTTDDDEFFYGGGQQNGSFSHKGTRIEIVADANWNEGGHPNPAPFYMSNRGYGVLRNTFAHGAYDFTGGNEIALAHSEDRFDAFYFVGDSFNRVLDLYTQFTGRPNFIPRWGLGLGDADAYMTRDKKTKEPTVEKDGTFTEITPSVIDAVAKKYRENEMPADWLLVNDGYGCGYTQLPYVVDELAKLGFHTGLWTEGALVKTKFEVGTAGTRVQKLDVAWSGPAYQHGLQCNKSAYDSFIENSNARPFIWTVQGWAGTQRYGVCWTGDQSGDWDLIRYHIPTLITSGMSGQAYATTDVDGIFGGSPETFTRDLQWKCFTPAIYAMNGWAKISKSPWSYEEPYRSINRKYLRMKSALKPYVYKYAHDAAVSGAPIVRGMIWNFPQDRKTWDKSTQYQFMLGDSILVAPVYVSMAVNRGWRKEDIYLPEGLWVDFWDGRRIKGATTIDAYPITLEKMPILVRGGAIIPLYPEHNFDAEKPFDPLTFDIYPHGESSFELYEDDGSTRDWEKGKFATQKISVSAPEWKPGEIKISLEPLTGDFDGKLASRVYQFFVHVPAAPLAVKAGEKEIPEVAAADFEKADEGWFFDPDRNGIIRIKLARRATSESVKLAIAMDETKPFPESEPYPVPENTGELDKSEFIVKASSEHAGTGIRNAFDGSPETFWHSDYSDKGTHHPYTVDVDLTRLVAVNGLSYLPREGIANGSIKGYEIYVSRSPEEFGEPVAKGEFPKEFASPDDKKTPKLQQVSFPTVWGRYVRIKILSSQSGGTHGSAAEFDISQDMTAAPLPDEVIELGSEAIEPEDVSGKVKFNSGIDYSKIVVDGVEYKNGITAKIGSEIVYKLDGSYDKLKGHVGREAHAEGNVTFRVFADGKQIFERLGQKPNDVKQLLDVNISGMKELRLVLVGDDDTPSGATGVWANISLVRKGSEE